jgi:DNA-binding transcriptional LysR family regulator
VISIEQLCREPLITNSPTSGTRQLLRERLDLVDKHDADLNIVMELQNSELVKQMAARRPGVGLVSRLVMAQRDLDVGLVMLSIDDNPIYRSFNLVTTWKSQERPNVRSLCEIAAEIYSEEMLFAAL